MNVKIAEKEHDKIVADLNNDIARWRNRYKAAEDKLQKIERWCLAYYPPKVFPEPDFKDVRTALEAAGLTLDSVSASIMRRVLMRIVRIVEERYDGPR